MWINCNKYVPITGKRQCRLIAVTQPPPRVDGDDLSVHEVVEKSILQTDDPHSKKALEDFKNRLLPEEDPRVKEACSILKRIVSASGLGHLRYMLGIVNDPSKPSDL